MLYFRRFVWFIAKKLIVICILLGMLVCGFYMAMNIANIRVVLEDGLEKRVDVLLTRQNAEALIEEAADKAEKPPLLKKIGGIFSRKYDKEGMLILKEEDFIS